MKKIIGLLLSLFIIISLVGCSSEKQGTVETIAIEENNGTGEYAGKTIILHTNDIHGGFIETGDVDGGLEGYAAIAAAKKHFENLDAAVILVDDGDFSQGSIYVSLNHGAAATDLMDQCGYDIVGLGNHEFDYGVDSLRSNFEGKRFKVICSNVYKGDDTLFDSEVIAKVGDLKIGFFGLLTPETQTKVSSNYVQDLTFTEGQDLYDVAQKEADLLHSEADLVICLSHLGVDASSEKHRSEDVYANTTGIDFIIDGHSHTIMEAGSNGEPIQSTGTKAQYIGVIVIDNKTKTIESNFLYGLNDIEADIPVLDSAQNYMKEIDEKYSSIFANTSFILNGVKEDVRSKETNLADLITDAMLWGILKDGSIDVEDENIVVVTNGGGIRASIAEGGISMKDINNVLPFGNTLSVSYCTGAELLEALEASTYAVPDPLGGFPQVAGIEFVVDSSIAYDAGEEYPNSTYCGPNSINRVTVQSINGNPFDENAKYAIVTNNFCASGGDTYYALKKAYDEGKGFDTGIALDEVVVDYISNALDGKIGEQYAESQGRITIK